MCRPQRVGPERDSLWIDFLLLAARATAALQSARWRPGIDSGAARRRSRPRPVVEGERREAGVGRAARGRRRDPGRERRRSPSSGRRRKLARRGIRAVQAPDAPVRAGPNPNLFQGHGPILTRPDTSSNRAAMADLTEIKSMIESALPGAEVEVIDETGAGDHCGPRWPPPSSRGSRGSPSTPRQAPSTRGSGRPDPRAIHQQRASPAPLVCLPCPIAVEDGGREAHCRPTLSRRPWKARRKPPAAGLDACRPGPRHDGRRLRGDRRASRAAAPARSHLRIPTGILSRSSTSTASWSAAPRSSRRCTSRANSLMRSVTSSWRTPACSAAGETPPLQIE